MEHKKYLELILEHLDEGVIAVDKDFKIIYFNEPSTNLTGVESGKAIGMKIFDVFKNIHKSNSTFWKVINTKRPILEYVQNYVNCRGENTSILSTTIPIIEANKVLGAIEIFRDITHVKELTEKLILLQDELGKKIDNSEKDFKNGTQYILDDLISKDSRIINLKKNIRRISRSSSPVYVYGETGTGKEILVQGIHNSSIRKDKPFIAQNCGSLPKSLLESILFGTTVGSFTGAKDRPGLFELADGGTLFLDELDSLDIELQSKLLRVLEDGIIRRIGGSKTKKIDVRVIVASNTEPEKLLEKKILREDLFYRVNVIYFKIPPLRERKGDIPILIDSFIKDINKTMNTNIKGIDKEVEKLFLNNNWEGNVRELKNKIESAMNFMEGEYIGIEDLKSANVYYECDNELRLETEKRHLASQVGLKEAVENYEKEIIQEALEQSDYNGAKAARLLKVPKQTLHGKLKKYDLL